MYPLFRLVSTVLGALRAPALTLIESSEVSFRCRPWDLDVFMEMNNGRVLTLYDLGRTDLSIRCGLAKQLKQHKWGLVVAGSTVRYRKRVRVFNKVTMRTRLAGVDERWIYLEQSMWVKGQPCSSVLLRTAVTAKGKTVATERVMAAMQLGDIPMALADWPKQWIDSEDKRPWPPL